MRHTIATWVEKEFDGDKLRIIPKILEHAINTNLNVYSHKHRHHAEEYTQCISEMIPKLPRRMTTKGIDEAHVKAALEVLDSQDKIGRLVLDDLHLTNANKLGIYGDRRDQGEEDTDAAPASATQGGAA